MFNLENHSKHSSEKLNYLDPETNERFVPHVIEPSFGMDRTVLALLASVYTEDEMEGETRFYLKFKPNMERNARAPEYKTVAIVTRM